VPRHPDEAEWIHDHAKKRAFGSVALTLLADESTVMDRIKHRAEMGSRTETPERIAARLDVYKTNQRAILKTLEPVLHDVIELDTTDLSPDEVFEKFNRRI
jgi:predicted component of type VI protein secretion system